MRIIQLVALESFLGNDGRFLVPAASEHYTHPTDYFHPDANKVLEEFKRERGLSAVSETNYTGVGGIKIGRSVYDIGNQGALFIATDIRGALNRETEEDRAKGIQIYYGHRGQQTLTFMGTNMLDDMAQMLFAKYQSLKTVSAQICTEKPSAH